MEQHLTDEDSSESITSYMDDLDVRRKHDKRDSAGRSIRSSRQSLKSSPQRSFDEDSEAFLRRSFRHARDRRGSSAARSVSSRSERRSSQRVRSDSTQDSETEIGTRALVQAKIREKVAQAEAESMDESSSDLWKPKSKSTSPAKTVKTPSTTNKKEITASTSNKKLSTVMSNKVANKGVNLIESKNTSKSAIKQTDRRKSLERALKLKPEIPSTVKSATKMVVKQNTILNGSKSSEKLPMKKDEASISEKDESNEVDPISVPDTAPEGPPKTPDYEWTCEYCTFENEANVKICDVCCKTPSSNAIRKQTSPDKDKQPTTINGKINESADISKEGRSTKNTRKISFWTDTKPNDRIKKLQRKFET